MIFVEILHDSRVRGICPSNVLLVIPEAYYFVEVLVTHIELVASKVLHGPL